MHPLPNTIRSLLVCPLLFLLQDHPGVNEQHLDQTTNTPSSTVTSGTTLVTMAAYGRLDLLQVAVAMPFRSMIRSSLSFTSSHSSSIIRIKHQWAKCPRNGAASDCPWSRDALRRPRSQWTDTRPRHQLFPKQCPENEAAKM